MLATLLLNLLDFHGYEPPPAREIVRGYLDFIKKHYPIPTPPQKRVADREKTYLAAGEHPTDGEESG